MSVLGRNQFEWLVLVLLHVSETPITSLKKCPNEMTTRCALRSVRITTASLDGWMDHQECHRAHTKGVRRSGGGGGGEGGAEKGIENAKICTGNC